MGRLRRAIKVSGLLLVVVLLLIGISGFVLFGRARVDALQRADAVIVLSGEHDGRESYGISLARQGWARTAVISNPYLPGDQVMARVCGGPHDGVEVICPAPFPVTTRGEADMVRRLSAQRGWNRVIVVSSRFHLPRARFIFRQCFSDRPDAVEMEAVPRPYDYSVLMWDFVYAYQYAGLAKALLQGACT